jgi:23S rRNA G2445 N2-methylase RlmL
MSMDLFATAAKGTEGALRDELRELGVRGVRATRGGVGFSGDLGEAARVCLHTRIAVRVLWRLGAFPAPSGDALYDGVRALDWAPHIGPRQTLAVRASCKSSGMTHTQFIAQRTKDAVVDQLRDRFGARPSVSLDDPDLLINLRLADDEAEVLLDVSGASLHQRGWRREGGEAPLKETLAAAMLRLGGWDRESPLVDPMCGAGTLAIEAASWAAGIAPGLSRKLGIERWLSFDEALRRRLNDLRAEARDPKGVAPPIFARDIDAKAIDMTRANARRAGVTVVAERADVRQLRPLDPPGFVFCNPPYDERIAAGPSLHRELAAALRRMSGHTVVLLAGNDAIGEAMRRKPEKWWLVHNGAIPCKILRYTFR